jgi:thiol-disulfide isomerase/thioredoxin
MADIQCRNGYQSVNCSKSSIIKSGQNMSVIKNLCLVLTAFLFSVFAFCEAAAQEAANPDRIKLQLDSLIASKDPSDRRLLTDRLKSLSGSNIEMEMAIAATYYYQIKDARAFDSVNAAQLIKFPKGLESRIRVQQKISLIKSLPELEKAYYNFVKNFPPDSYPRLPFGEDRLPYDRLRSNLANRYAKEKNVTMATYYAGLMEADFWKVKSYGDLADTFYTTGNLTLATLYQKKAVESSLPYAAGKMGSNAAANFAIKGYARANRTYARMLYEQKKYGQALQFVEIAIKAITTWSAEDNFLYSEVLASLGRNEDAYKTIETAVKSGEATAEMSEFFKVLYMKVKGSTKGLELYQAAIEKGVKDNLRKSLEKTMVNEPATDFLLTDLQGNRVSLAELKGKIVILDFWATWCVPCKASFPGMQMAVEKYKNDPGVKFLFIHTWERTTTANADAKAYIESMNYDFQVLMDIKDPETKSNKVVENYNVSSIPAKFIIDEKGSIRFKLKGFNGSKAAAVDEISMMINMVREKAN